MTAAQHKKLAFAWIAANIILIPHIRPVEGTASLYTDLILGLSGLPLCWWVWRDRHETLTYHFAWETPLLTLILLIFLTLPALRDLIGGSQTLTPHWHSTDRNARMPDHYYLELFAKPLATVPTTLRIRRTTYDQLNRIRGSRSERPPAIRVEYWPHSRTLKHLDIPETP
ncbi:hypothetical protein [uncultured Cardiobacterium sp.]|uniref:hypothetical protein n=1 Tax=uncultured Cardiobacterium sp. TaxID=417619 RepID=UPI00263285A5|nr:hypothetical protein [uncultured Cardiobacterium sp.]